MGKTGKSSKKRVPLKLSSEADIMGRILASLCGLPKVCTTRRCRRVKRCVGPDAHCLVDHSGLLERRCDAKLAQEATASGLEVAGHEGAEFEIFEEEY